MVSRDHARLKDVATLAGISVATASRALSGTGYTSEETRAKIFEVAKTLNYQPNLQARGLRKRSSSTIGLLIPNLKNSYYTSLADLMSQLLSERGYHLLLASTRDDPKLETEIIHDFVGRSIDGLIWVPVNAEEKITHYLKKEKLPTVAIVRRVVGDVFDTIVFEDFSGSRAATQYLINLGHRRIGYIGGDVKYSSNFDRWQGYLKALGEAGLPVDESLIKLGTLRSLWGEVAAGELLRNTPPPTALFVSSNAIIPGVLKALHQYGLAVPGKISLVCFDDLEWFTFIDPPITSVSIKSTELGEAAVGPAHAAGTSYEWWNRTIASLS